MRFEVRKRTLMALALAAVPALALFPFAGGNVLPLLLLLAFGTGCSNIVAEYILVDQVYRSKDVSTEIGVLYVPLRLAEFLFLSLGGLVISRFGYGPPFIVLAASIALFVLFGRSVIRQG
jgi:predicted MFS family arabinose efflux permease